jgi:hypothetical protein
LGFSNVISASAIYLLPFHRNRWNEGWQLTAIQAFHTGVPFEPGEGDQAGLQNIFDNEHPNYVDTGFGVMKSDADRRKHPPSVPRGTVQHLQPCQFSGSQSGPHG